MAEVVERTNGVGSITITLNGEVVFEENGLGKNEHQIKAPITFKGTENTLSVVAYSTKKVKSSPR